jgi:hypothetical protein
MSEEHVARLERIRRECSVLDALHEETLLLDEAITPKSLKRRAASRPTPDDSDPRRDTTID